MILVKSLSFNKTRSKVLPKRLVHEWLLRNSFREATTRFSQKIKANFFRKKKRMSKRNIEDEDTSAIEAKKLKVEEETNETHGKEEENQKTEDKEEDDSEEDKSKSNTNESGKRSKKKKSIIIFGYSGLKYQGLQR